MNPLKFVYISLVSWYPVMQRPHHLAAGLAQSNTVLFVEQQSLFPLLRKPSLESFRTQLRSETEHLHVVRVPPLLPDRWFRWTNALNYRILAYYLKPVLAKLEFDDYILWLTYPPQVEIVKWLKPALVCYDCMDNYPLFHEPASPKHRLMERLEQKLLSLADVVYVLLAAGLSGRDAGDSG